MSETKFTGGPWAVTHEYGPEGSISKVRDNDGRIICEVIPDFIENYEEIRADAHLIAAAPELYEACQDAFDQMYLLAKSPSDNPWCKQLRAALAKARGETS